MRTVRVGPVAPRPGHRAATRACRTCSTARITAASHHPRQVPKPSKWRHLPSPIRPMGSRCTSRLARQADTCLALVPVRTTAGGDQGPRNRRAVASRLNVLLDSPLPPRGSDVESGTIGDVILNLVVEVTRGTKGCELSGPVMVPTLAQLRRMRKRRSVLRAGVV